eukprot:4311243-Alexandrium_andersonii.AAC.1
MHANRPAGNQQTDDTHQANSRYTSCMPIDLTNTHHEFKQTSAMQQIHASTHAVQMLASQPSPVAAARPASEARRQGQR